MTRIDIITNTPAKVLIDNDILDNVHNRTKIQTLRDIRPLKISSFNDSISKSLIIDSRNSFAYWLNIYNCGFGMLIDKDKPKRYTYPARIFVDMTNNKNTYTLFDPLIKKGELHLHFSLPQINSFLLNPDNENDYKSSLGFWGFRAGLDYYYKRNQFVNLSFSGVSDFYLFPVEISGENDIMSSLYLSLSNNYKLKRFSIGYGFSFSSNTWDHRYSTWGDPPPPKREPVKKTNSAIGFIFPFYYQAGTYFFLGMIYRPSFIKVFPTTEMRYEHLISIDFGWKIPLTK